MGAAGTGKAIGTTKRGIGPAYASKATRNGIRVCDLQHFDSFPDKLRKLAHDGASRFGEAFVYDVEGEIVKYKQYAEVGDAGGCVHACVCARVRACECVSCACFCACL